MNKKFVLAIILLVILPLINGCEQKTKFEKFAHEMCVLEGKYTEKICSCNAKNLEASLTSEEKAAYRKAGAGDVSSLTSMLGIIDKLRNAIIECVS